MFDKGLDRRKAGARGQKDHGLVALVQVEAAKRAFDAQDLALLHRTKHVVGKKAAGCVADMQLQTGRGLLVVRRDGHRIGAAHTTSQQELDVLAGMVAKAVGRWQLQAQLDHIGREALNGLHAHRHFLDRKGAFIGDMARLDHHIAGRHGAARQDHAVGLFLGAQRAFAVGAMHNRAAELLAFAGAAGAILAAIGQAHAAADGRGEDGFRGLGGKCASAGQDRDLKRAGRRAHCTKIPYRHKTMALIGAWACINGGRAAICKPHETLDCGVCPADVNHESLLCL